MSDETQPTETKEKRYPIVLVASGIAMVAIGVGVGVLITALSSRTETTAADSSERSDVVAGTTPSGSESRGAAAQPASHEMTAHDSVVGATIASAEDAVDDLPGELLSTVQQQQAFQESFQARLAAIDVSRRTDFANLSTSIKDIDGFAEQLGQLAKSYPQLSSAPQYRRAAIEAPIWRGTLQWVSIFEKIDRGLREGLRPGQARELIREGDRIAERWRIAPYEPSYRKLRPHLFCVSSRLDHADKRLDQRVTALLDEDAYAHLNLVILKSGQRYYVRAGSVKNDPQKREAELDYVVDLVGLKTKKKRIKWAEIKPGVTLAPHCALARKVRERLQLAEDLAGRQWESVFCNAIVDVTQAADADPLVRLTFFENLLRVACLGSEPMTRAFDRHLRALEESAKIDRTANWIAPQTAEDRTAIAQATEFFRRLPAVPKACEHALRLAVNPAGQDVPTLEWVGCLGGASATGWEFFGSPPAQAGKLRTVYRDRNLSVKISTVAEVFDGVIRWQEGEDEAFVEGRPLFFQPVR
ncbi:hypothetical protein Enr13x_20810 [Stieleria neptunia]|uniref:Uncharacterized protein n=1 Tax=Stieleria neptunia TaxID=2527979 RepID=A0A518HN12_9BACT|nr:hypothetical protein [Stieleria neptunia]QDV42236.1 hypothetical protein Enr13x_20810 [Stieleria neptunia]